ncbi:MAG: response regulator [Desulfovibrionaceae bacterium]|nr:response regulator [Desulfovibrionaceae bacterium]
MVCTPAPAARRTAHAAGPRPRAEGHTGSRPVSGRPDTTPRLFLAALLLLAAVLAPVGAAPAQAAPHHVLLISSYHPSFPTFFQQIEGLHSVFDPAGVALDVEFMDSKRLFDESNLSNFLNMLRYKLYHLPSYDAIVTADDNALNFALLHKEELFPHAPIVFCGVNDETRALSMNRRDDVTGVIESVSLRETVHLAERLLPGLTTVAVVTDPTPSGQADLAKVRALAQAMPAPTFRFLDLGAISFDAMADELRALPHTSCVLLLSAYRDVVGRSMSFPDSLRLIHENADAPIFHLWEHGLGQGVLGGRLVTHREQGRTAGRMVLRILRGVPVPGMPVLSGDAANRYMFDYNELERFDIPLDRLPEKSTVINRPDSLFRHMVPVLWVGGGVLALMVAAILVLVTNIRARRKAEKRLHKSWRLYRAYIELAPDAVLIADEGGRFVEVNNAACGLSGHGRDELLAMSLRELAAPEAVETSEDHFRTLLVTGRSSGDITFRRKGGERSIVFVNAARITDDRYILLCRDLTETRRDERRLAMINECLLGFGPNPDENIRLLTELLGALTGAACTYYCRVRGETLGTVCAWNTPETLQRDRRLDRHLCAHVLYAADSGPFHVPELADLPPETLSPEALALGMRSYFGAPVKARGAPMGVVSALFSTPFTPRASDEWLLGIVALATGVEEERRLAADELLHAKERAEAASRSKDEFLANMSHEIRTPLNGVCGMLQIAREQSLDSHQAEVIDTALASTASLTTILNDILDFSKIEAGRMDLTEEPFSPRKCLETVAGNFTLEVDNRGLAFEAEVADSVPDVLLGDEARLRQILFNLVGNAVKFTPHGSVRVRMERLHAPTKDARMRLYITVADTGVGIPEDKQDLIFEAFTQVDGTYTRRYQGTGLGLGIVRRLLTLMKGSLTVESEVDVGTTMHLVLPFRAPDRPLAETGAASAPTLPAGLRVLLVEDDLVNRIAARRLLERRGCRITEAANGSEALAALARDRFDCVLMDVQMPVMDGLKAVRAIRSGGLPGVDARVPVIALTAHAMKGDRETFLEAGMDAYIAKPVDVDVLARTLAAMVGRA